MKVVWRLGVVTVRDVHAALRESRDVAYTTVMTMMNILETKGYLKKEKTNRAYRYRPVQPERVVVGSMVREFINRVFDGASRPLLLHLVKESRLSAKERDELLRLIKESN
jgi:predicted transcriptional regulator